MESDLLAECSNAKYLQICMSFVFYSSSIVKDLSKGLRLRFYMV